MLNLELTVLILIFCEATMAHRWQIAISAGLLAAVWAGLADVFHLVTWIGFLGCSYQIL